MTADAGNLLYGLVLAGGQSRRMGRDKALLMQHGRTQLETAVLLLAPVTEQQFVSTRREQAGDAERSRYPQIVDRYDDIGPVAGILSAMEEYPNVDWLVVACDLPNLDALTLGQLVEKQSRTRPFTAYRSSHDGLPEPLCAIYRSDAQPLVRQFVDNGITCPRKILIRSDTKLLNQPNPEALHNVNTPEDLGGGPLGTPT